jgi:hypothetical protein
MSTKLVIFGLLGMLGAAGTGGYLALRQNAVDGAVPLYQTGTPVHASEAIVPEPAAEPERAPARPAAALDRVQDVDRPVAQPRPAQKIAARPKASQPAVAAPAPAPEPQPDVRAPLPAPTPVAESLPELADVRLAPVSVPAPAPEPLEEVLTIERNSVIGIRLESDISSQTAEVEDLVTARVTRDVTVEDQSAISSGARLEGVVASVERGGKFKDRARIGVRFNSLVLADGTRLPIETETIFRESESPTGKAAAKVGAGAAVGGILGAVFGGKKGAAIGSTVGAAGGTAAVVKGAPANAELPAGTALTVRLTAPLTVTILRED